MENACSRAEGVLASLKGIIRVQRLDAAQREAALKLEREAEEKVLMGLCKGINVGLREALSKKNAFACLTDETMVWPQCSYIKLYCGDELIGRDIYDEAELTRRKEAGDIVAGNLVFYKDKMGRLKERPSEMRVHMMPMEIAELCACGAVVASPSPPSDNYLKGLLGADPTDRRLGTIVVGVD
jgi:hypothetical protein